MGKLVTGDVGGAEGKVVMWARSGTLAMARTIAVAATEASTAWRTWDSPTQWGRGGAMWSSCRSQFRRREPRKRLQRSPTWGRGPEREGLVLLFSQAFFTLGHLVLVVLPASAGGAAVHTLDSPRVLPTSIEGERRRGIGQ
jgi:hypothetical protein